MEIREIVEYSIGESMVEVHYRTIDDSDDVIRISEFELDIIDDYGYDVISYPLDFLDEEEFFEDDEEEIDEVELISFMNEYFLIKPDKLPKPENY
jgi:uncharacterized protein YutD